MPRLGDIELRDQKAFGRTSFGHTWFFVEWIETRAGQFWFPLMINDKPVSFSSEQQAVDWITHKPS